MDMATHKITNISTPSSPSEPGLFTRFLQRTRSKRERKGSTAKDASTANPTSKFSEPKSRKDNRVSPTPASASASASATGPDSQLPVPVSPTATDTMGAPVALLQHHQQPSGLRKRASIRDRLRGLARDHPTPAPDRERIQEKQQRVVYVPTHAASDFSRLAVSPRPPSRQHYSSEEPRTLLQGTEPLDTVAAGPAEDDSQHVLTQRPYSPRGLQTLAEDEPIHATAGQPHDTHRAITLPPPANGADRNISESAEPTPVAETGQQDSSSPPNDYDLFLTRAEERDRTYREQLVRKLSQRHYPRPVEQESPYPYHTTDSAVVTDPPRKEGRTSGLDSGIGSKTSSSHQEPPARVSNGTWERGHRKHTSWTPSFRQGGNENLEPLDEGGHLYTTAAVGGKASFAEWSQPRTVKRQGSIKKRLGEYIRPVKVASRYEEPEYEPGAARAELKRGRSRRVV